MPAAGAVSGHACAHPQRVRSACASARAPYGMLEMASHIRQHHMPLAPYLNVLQIVCRLESALSLGVVCAINLWVVSVFAAGFYNPAADPPDIGLQNAGVGP